MEENLKVIWEQRYNDWKESGLSKSQWCEKKKLNIQKE